MGLGSALPVALSLALALAPALTRSIANALSKRSTGRKSSSSRCGSMLAIPMASASRLHDACHSS